MYVIISRIHLLIKKFNNKYKYLLLKTIMGIPYYFYNIYKKYNDLAIDKSSISKLNVHYLFLDYNSLIHPCAQEVIKNAESVDNEKELEEKIIKNCILYTRYIIDVIGAKDIYIMIDGVAPRAKMKQQRERRYKTYFLKKLQKKEEQKDEQNSIEWDSNKITPGTLFMDSIKIALDKLKNDMKDYCNIYISDSDICGEGEHKMMKEIEKIKPNKKVCIYGLDADLIMLSLINSYFDKIILLRDNTFNINLKESEKTYTYIDIFKLKRNICNELYAQLDQNFKEKDDLNIIYDYIFLCFLLGNDFLEHVPTLMIKENGINLLLKSYLYLLAKKKSYLINVNKLRSGELDKSIDLRFLKDLFYQLSNSEDFFYNKVYSVYKKDKKNVYKDVYNIEEKNDTIYIYKKDIIEYNKSGYKKRHYDFYGVNDVNDACKNYITGLYWILGYYHNHLHNNWTWFYKYKEIPFASDIFNYLNKNDHCTVIKEGTPNTTLEQLIMVLPKKSLLNIIEKKDIILYKKMVRIFNTHSNYLNEYYPDNICLDMIHKEFMWQSKIFLKDFQNNFLEYFVI